MDNKQVSRVTTALAIFCLFVGAVLGFVGGVYKEHRAITEMLHKTANLPKPLLIRVDPSNESSFFGPFTVPSAREAYVEAFQTQLAHDLERELAEANRYLTTASPSNSEDFLLANSPKEMVRTLSEEAAFNEPIVVQAIVKKPTRTHQKRRPCFIGQPDLRGNCPPA